ncbi:MAG: transporter permease [Solirubrobacterales bacterium]|jgi:putative hydroxymethylpyrimidine transport system permease protein|nr:transporter permease [Solirubrobacterales bacterium]
MPALLIALAFLGAWELYTVLSDLDEFVLPPPSAVARSLAEDRGLLAENFATTALEMLAGLGVALVLGVALTTLLHLSARARRGVYPLLIGTQVIPIVLVAPLLVAWFGFGTGPKLAIVAVVCFFPIVVPTLDALERIDPDRLKLLRTLGASRWQVLRFAEAPSALPALFTGARLAVAIAAIAAVLAEYSGSEKGLGRLVLQSIPQLETARAYAAIVVLMTFTLALYTGLTALERRLLPWAVAPPKGPSA